MHERSSVRNGWENQNHGASLVESGLSRSTRHVCMFPVLNSFPFPTPSQLNVHTPPHLTLVLLLRIFGSFSFTCAFYPIHSVVLKSLLANRFLAVAMPIRNPFVRRPGVIVVTDENQRPTPVPGFERVDTVGSKGSSVLSIRSTKGQDNGEYKMSGRLIPSWPPSDPSFGGSDCQMAREGN